MKAEITQYQCCIPLKKMQWKRLNDKIDDCYHGDGNSKFYNAFMSQLEKAGSENRHLDWSGHFGSNIFFTCETPEQIEAITKVISKWLDSPISKWNSLIEA